MNEISIGKTKCPVCGVDCDLKETKKNKAYINCRDCGSQTFARGYEADKKMREAAQPIAALPEQKATDLTPPPVKVTVTKHSSEGQTVKKERTIFDMVGDMLNERSS